MDGDATTISEKEYKTLLTLMDAEFSETEMVYTVDRKITAGKTNGMNQIDEFEIGMVYGEIQTEKEQQVKQNKGNETLKNLKEQISQFDLKDNGDMTKAINFLMKNIDDKEQLAKAINELILNNQAIEINYGRSSGTIDFTMPEGSEIYSVTLNYSGEKDKIGNVDIMTPDLYYDTYRPDETKVEEE